MHCASLLLLVVSPTQQIQVMEMCLTIHSLSFVCYLMMLILLNIILMHLSWVFHSYAKAASSMSSYMGLHFHVSFLAENAPVRPGEQDLSQSHARASLFQQPRQVSVLAVLATVWFFSTWCVRSAHQLVLPWDRCWKRTKPCFIYLQSATACCW